MTAPTYFIGLDLDEAKRFAACIVTASWKPLAGPSIFADSLEGYHALLNWLDRYHCVPAQTVVCMEATGFVGEPLAYFLRARDYSVAIEPLVKVRRVFPVQRREQYVLDSQHVAEYAYRHLGKLSLWQPPAEKLERIKALLSEQDEQNLSVDANIRRMLAPRPSLTEEWPCY